MATSESSIPRRRLVRRREGRVLAGVCTGLADFTGLDVVVFRIGFVLLSIAGASGVLAYLLAAIFIPSDGDEDAAGSRALDTLRAGADRLRRLPTWVSVLLVAIGTIALAGTIGTPHPGILWAIALIAIGILLLNDDTRPVAPPRAAAAADTTTSSTAAGATAAGATAPIARAQRPPRERSPLPWLTLSLAFVAVGLAILADQVAAIHLQLGQFFGIALATLGAGVLISARWGRARTMILVSVLLLPLALGSSIVRMPLRGTVGTVSYSPVSIGQVQPRYELLAGDMNLDLSQVDFRGDHTVNIDAVAGTVIVYVPRNVRTTVDGHVQAGDVRLFGAHRAGVTLNFARAVSPRQATGTLHLHTDGTATTIQVYRVAYDGPPSPGNRAKTHHKEGPHAKP